MREVNASDNTVSLQTLKPGIRDITIVCIACVLLSLIHCPLFEIFYDDKEIFKYTGMVIAHGGTPYKDFFDHKPPLIFFLNYFGLILGPWGLWIIDTALVIATSFLFLNLCKKNKIAYAWLLPVVFNIMLRNNVVSYGIGMTREYTSIFLLLFFLTQMASFRSKYYILGILSAFIFFMQQEQVFPLIPFLFYAVLSGDKRSYLAPLKKTGSICIGFLLITIIIVLYFTFHHSLKYFWEDAFIYNLKWYSEKKPLSDHAKAIFIILKKSGYDLALYISLALGIFSLISGNTKNKLLTVSLIAAAFSFAAELLSGKLVSKLSVEYYLLPLSASLTILLFVVFAYSKHPFLQHKFFHVLYVLIISFNLALVLLKYCIHLKPDSKNFMNTSPEFEYLQKQKLHDFELYIFYNSSATYMYNQFKILSPSRWIYQYSWNWFDNWDSRNEKLAEIKSALIERRTTFILDYSNTSTFRNKDNYYYWKSFLQEHYIPIMNGDSTTVLWKIK
ncbi:MAG: hypothetical protein JST75_09875 [Bacteroidetes bacterium]|nr:hypothetical protein [Bacteroidota bacterium]